MKTMDGICIVVTVVGEIICRLISWVIQGGQICFALLIVAIHWIVCSENSKDKNI